MKIVAEFFFHTCQSAVARANNAASQKGYIDVSTELHFVAHTTPAEFTEFIAICLLEQDNSVLLSFSFPLSCSLSLFLDVSRLATSKFELFFNRTYLSYQVDLIIALF